MEVGGMERQVLGPGGRGTGSRSQASGLRTRDPPTPCEGGLAAPPGAPRSSAEVSGALASCLLAEAESWGWRREVGGGPLRGRGAGGKQTAARAAPPPRPSPARRLTVGAVALPRAGHLRGAQAALGRHREAAQHVGGREQVRRLHAAARRAVCAVRTVEAASSRGYCAGRGALGPGRVPRKAMSALGPSPTAVAAAAKA